MKWKTAVALLVGVGGIVAATSLWLSGAGRIHSKYPPRTWAIRNVPLRNLVSEAPSGFEYCQPY